MKILRILILMLILWNLPSITLFAFSESLGSLMSYLTIGLLGLYYLFEKKTQPNWWIIILALMYFTISSFQYYGPPMDFILETIKYFVFVIGGYELVKRVNKEQLFIFMTLGALSVAVEAFFFPSKFGRYAGFYLNPNEAGFICLYGYALVYSFKNASIKLLGQFTFTLMGLLTFSRTFIVIWVVLNLVSLKISLKNIRILGIGVLLFATLLFIDETVGLNNPRFDQLKSIVNNESVSTSEVGEDSRMSTWSHFYDKILKSPFIGNGYGTLSGKLGSLGVHNTYLMVIGEAGIIPFLLLIFYIGYLVYWSIYFFKKTPYLIMQTIALALFLLTDHNFFVHYYVAFVAMWIQYQIAEQKMMFNNYDSESKIGALIT
ncbi:O-antigen ligase family protein [Subsaxibacter sp. CAU 1640]|uniref:O-antigen ligase family protein n=1 Tax=Subsaxibacter sp. CAU 1640 TaxID=2933271 RepID=UPI0020037818|nr:O-antigen ligase family protein [Subsaxibacter sp. CAU 1640]MCK7591030.1 O-antigen ligase family protein [Subsaxibacter sp. CAU 1640]